MANPTLTPFPTPPLPEQDEVTFNRNAANSLLAQANFVNEGNIVITWMGQQIDAAAASKKAAADSATAAGQAVTDAQAQVKLASDQAVASKGSADAAKGYRDSAQVSAQAAQAAAGLPPNNNPGWYLRQKLDGSGGVEWVQLVVSQIGDTLVSTQAPDSTWVPTGRTYSQATYPNLYAKLGAIADWIPSQQLTGNIPNSYTYTDLVYGNGLFVGLDASGNAIAITSPDGITWTQRNLPSTSTWAAVEYGTNFVAVSTSTSNVALTSPDGITWTVRTLPSQSSWSAIKYNNGTYLATVGGATTAATSTDGGVTWTGRTLPVSIRSGYLSLSAGAGVFLMLTPNSTTYYTSANGISWTARTLNFIPIGAVYANGVFMVWGSAGTACATSPDGLTWTQYALPSTSSDPVIAGGGGQFLLKSPGSTTYYTTTTDVTRWAPRTSPMLDNTSSKMVYGNKSFVSLDSNGNSVRRVRKPWSYDNTVQFFTTDQVVPSQGLNQYIKAT